MLSAVLGLLLLLLMLIFIGPQIELIETPRSSGAFICLCVSNALIGRVCECVCLSAGWSEGGTSRRRRRRNGCRINTMATNGHEWGRGREEEMKEMGAEMEGKWK